MKQAILSIFIISLVGVGCMSATSSNPDDAYLPSISNLKTDEVLIMNVLECHRGCTTGTVEFKGRQASLIPNQISLTAKEISQLESYFFTTIDFNDDTPNFNRRLDLTEEEISDLEDYFIEPHTGCSKVIKMSFEHKKGTKVLNSTPLKTYKCSFEQKISPSNLKWYLKDERMYAPYWRLSPEELAKLEAHMYNQD